jgi:hypothetical protein
MSLIVKTTEKTDSNNTISLPPAIDSSKISISSGDFIVSYNTLEEGNVHKKFLTTDCLTEDATEDSAVKVLSMSAFSAYEGQIFDIISNTNNNNVCTVVYSVDETALPLDDNKLYNAMNTDGIVTITDETYFSEYDGLTNINTNSGVIPVNLFALAAHDADDKIVLQFLKDGIYKINYSLCFNLANTDTSATPFTPHVKMIRGIKVSDVLNHHSSVMTDLTTEPTPSAVTYYPSYIVNNSTVITPYGAAETYLYNVSGSVTISMPDHESTKTEYLGIFIGVDYTSAKHTFKSLEDKSDTGTMLYFVTNIEYIGT